MALAPLIETRRLRLAPFGAEHLTPRYVAWLNDPEVMRYSEQRHRQHTLATCTRYWQSFAGSPNYLWAIELQGAAPTHLGNVNAYVDKRHRTAELGLLIGERAWWGQGLGREAWIAACGFLLNTAHLRKVMASTLAENRSMLAIMRASGMVEDGRRRRHMLLDGREVDLVHAALFRDEGSPPPSRKETKDR